MGGSRAEGKGWGGASAARGLDGWAQQKGQGFGTAGLTRLRQSTARLEATAQYVPRLRSQCVPAAVLPAWIAGAAHAKLPCTFRL